MKKKYPWMKRLAASLLSLGMVVTSMGMGPQTAFAADVTIGADSSQTLQEAIDAATEETTITLEKAITECVTIPEGKTITLDLNGQTITNKSADHTITNEGNLTITDSSADHKGTVDNISNGVAALWNEPGATAVLNGGNFHRSAEAENTPESGGGNSFYNIVNHGTMEINEGVVVKQTGHFSSLLENGWYDGKTSPTSNMSTLTINGGTFSGGINTIKNDDLGELTITGGTFENMTQHALLNWNIAEITGGKFSCTAEQAIRCNYGDYMYPDSDVKMDQGILSISGGSFAGAVAATSKATITITGGDYTVLPAPKYLETAYYPVENAEAGGYSVVAESENLLTMKEELTLYVGESDYLDAATSIANAKIVYTPSNATAIKVDAAGKVTALAEGTCTVSAVVEGIYNEGENKNKLVKECIVTVMEPEPEQILLNPVTMTLTEGESKTIKIASPSNATGAEWESNDATVATVDQSGVVKAVKEGKATITVSLGDKYIPAECVVTVNAKQEEKPEEKPEENPESKITLSKTALTLYYGQTYQLEATTVPEDAKVTWTSADINAVTVDETGLVTARNHIGPVKITASIDGGKTAVCTVTVKRPEISSSEATMVVGGKMTLTITPKMDNLVWESLNPKVAAVDENGNVTAVGAGVTSVYGYVGDVRIRGCRVTVKEGAGNVDAGDSSMTTENIEPSEIAAGMELAEGIDKEDVAEKIDLMLDDIRQTSVMADNPVGVVKEAEAGLKKDLKDGQNAKISLETELTDIQVKAALVGEGENARLVVTPEKLVYDVNAYQQIYDKNGQKVGEETKLENSKLSGRAFPILLPIPQSADKKYAKILHIADNGTKDTYYSAIKELEGEKYVEVSIRHFSTFEITFTDSIPSSGGSGSRSGGSSSGGTYRQASNGKSGEWIQNTTGWWFRYTDGTWPAGRWEELEWNSMKAWYYFNADGYMVSGWLPYEGNWYYLHPYADGNQGYMYTGWHEIGGKWYFFNTQAGGPLGSMAANTTTPDGFAVGADGAWIR